ncbi:hypothetical protein HRbin33_02106 [bacterium HR33]|nr:hypothetical protein HRbin33_02106 [bacterium HR33]
MSDATKQAPSAQVQLVDALMQLLVKAMRATQLYLPNNPVYQQAIQNLKQGFAPIWEYMDELVLDVAEADLVWEEKAVLSQKNRSDSVPWLLFKDGIRRITFLKGVERDEIARFLTVLNRAKNLPADADDDLLTLLWEQDFEFIRYDFVELAMPDAVPLAPSAEVPKAEPQELQRQVREEAEEPEPPKGLVSLEDFDSTLYFLDEEERAYLQQEVDREYSQDLRGNVLSMLFDLLELQTYSTVRAEVISILENFLPYLLAVGDFRSVAYVCREIGVVLRRARDLLPEHRRTLEEIPLRLSQPEALSQLLQSLDEAAVYPTEEELGELFREFRPEALETLLRWLPKLTNQRIKELLTDAARRLAQAHPEAVIQALKGKDESVLLQAIKMAGSLKLPPAAPALGALFAEASPQVKVAAVEALASIGSPGAIQELERAIDDSDKDVRVAAVRVLGQRGARRALSKIAARLDSKELRAADLTEKMAFFEAYGLLSGKDGIQPLSDILFSGGFFKRKEDPETRACAAMALGKIGTPEAREALQRGLKDKDPLVRNAAAKALKELG